MKKILTIVLSLVIMLAVGAGAITAQAKDPIISPETTEKHIVIKVTLNGEDSHHTSYTPDSENPNKIIFTYTGSGELVGWDFPGMIEGVDFVIVEETQSTITIKILNPDQATKIWANAVDKHPDETNPAKKDDSAKSPHTGAAAGGAALVSIGTAMLLAKKRKQ